VNALAQIGGLAVREAGPGDHDRIADFVRAHREGTLFHMPQWGEAVAAGCGQAGHVLIAERAGALAGVLPLTAMRSPLVGSALVSAGFGVGGGILANDDEAAARLANAAIQLAERIGAPGIELRGGRSPAGWQRNEDVYAGFERDLPDEEAAILAAIPRKQRAEVRRALSFDLEVRVGRTKRDRDDHYHVYSESVRNLGTPVFPRALFAAMLDRFADAEILTISRQGTPLASVLSFMFKGAIMPYWGGGTRDARRWRANELMYFALMRHAAERGCTRFDFGRSKVGTGAFAFKKNWGFAPAPLAYAHWGAVRETNPLSPRHRLKVEAWKRLPLWLANRMGPPIARGLG